MDLKKNITLKLLLIEPDPAAREALNHRLTGLGFIILQASHADQVACTLNSETSPPVSAVLLAPNLDEIGDGLALARDLLAERGPEPHSFTRSNLAVIFLLADGQELPLDDLPSGAACVQRSAAGSVLASVIHQAVRLAETRRDLQYSQLRYQQMVNNLVEGVWQFDRDMRMVAVNPSAAAMLGYTPEEMIGRSLFDFMNEHGAEISRRMVKRRERGIREQYTFEFMRKDGSPVLALIDVGPVYDENGQYTGSMAAIQDLSYQATRTKELFSARSFMANLLEYAPVAVYVTSLDGVITMVNRKWEEVVGHKHEEVVGFSLAEVFGEAVAANFLRTNQRVIESARPVMEEEVVQIGGQERVFYTVKFPIYDSRGRLRSIGGFSLDISQNKQTARALSTALEEKSTLLSDLQHRVKNNLQLIQSMVSLEANRTTQPEMRRVLEDLHDRVSSLSMLYTILYDSRAINDVNLGDYLPRIASSLAGSYLTGQKPVEVHILCERIIIDARRATSIGLILNELLTNALKYAFPVGREGQVWVRLYRPNGELCLVVEDDGVGLPEAFNLENPGGLGLQLAQILTRQLRGTFHYHAGDHTRFEVIVPL